MGLEVRTRGVENALGLARGAAGVEQEERILRPHPLHRAPVRLARNSLVPPNIAAGLPGCLPLGPRLFMLQHQHPFRLHNRVKSLGI